MGTLRRAALIFKTQKQRQALLENAVTSGDHDTAKALLTAGVAPDFSMQGQHPGTTPLMYAADKGDLAMIRLLLAAKADPLLLLNTSHMTAWHRAAAGGQTQAVALFLDAGVDINAAMPKGNNAIILAAANGQAETVQFLCEKKADVNLPGFSKRCALHWSCDRHDAKITKILLAHGARADLLTNKKDTPMMMLFAPDTTKDRAQDTTAAQQEIITALLAAQCPLEQHCKLRSETALHMAMRTKSLPAACALIAAGADIQAKNDKGLTPFNLPEAQADPAFLAALQKAVQDKKDAAKEKIRQLSDVRLRDELRPLRRIRLQPGKAQQQHKRRQGM